MRDITLCHPRLQKLAGKLIEECAKQGLIIMTTETLRTVAEQDALYAQGRTKPGNIITKVQGSAYGSFHQWGTAFDICFNDGLGAYNYKSNGKERVEDFKKVGAIGVSLGLEWGGNWTSIIDKPHFQLPDWGSGTSGIKKLYSNPEQFKKTWETIKEELKKEVEKKSGWKEENGGWRFYNGDTGLEVKNNWVEWDEKWYWFDGAGMMVRNTWYKYNGAWYYLGPDGTMCTSQLVENGGKIYAVDKDGKMITEKIEVATLSDGSIQYKGLAQ